MPTSNPHFNFDKRRREKYNDKSIGDNGKTDSRISGYALKKRILEVSSVLADLKKDLDGLKNRLEELRVSL